MTVTYRQSTGLLTFGALSMVGFGLAPIALMLSTRPLDSRLSSSTMCVLGCGVTYLLALRPKLTIDDDTVLCVGPVGRVRFPSNDLVRAIGERILVLERCDGARIQVWAVQNANITEMFGGGGRSERVAAEINLLLSGRVPSESGDLWD
jgi:hypothetical protein